MENLSLEDVVWQVDGCSKSRHWEMPRQPRPGCALSGCLLTLSMGWLVMMHNIETLAKSVCGTSDLSRKHESIYVAQATVCLSRAYIVASANWMSCSFTLGYMQRLIHQSCSPL